LFTALPANRVKAIEVLVLQPPSVKLYRQWLQSFSDAYCLPVRRARVTHAAVHADSDWHVSGRSFSGREEIIKFLTDKWDHELDYRLEKTLW
jgi:nuclear transport factor 2 (NTF2) superfamily protein